MKISILSGLFCRFPLERTFKIVSDIGFSGIELHGIRPHAYAYDMTPERIHNILKLSEKYNLSISMYTPELLSYPYNLASPYENERRESIDYVKKSIDVAKELGTNRVQITFGHTGYFAGKTKSLNCIKSTLSELANYAEKKEISVIVEPLTIMESNSVVMLDTMVSLLDDIKSEYVKSMLDSAMVMTNWEPVDAYFEKLGSKIDYIHWGDSNGTNESHMMIGKGMIDPQSFFDALDRRGYNGWVSIELFGKHIREPEIHAAREFNILQALLSRYNR